MHDGLFSSRKPTKDQWLTCAENKVIVSIVIKKATCAVELNINEGTREKSIAVYNHLLAERASIEAELGQMIWQLKENNVSAKIYQEIEKSFLDPKDESAIFKFFTERSALYIKVFTPYFQQMSMRVESKNEPSYEFLSENEVCKLFQEYMRNKGISEGSVKKYSNQVAFNADVREIVEKITGKDSLYKVTSPEEAGKIRVEVKSSPCDIKGHHMYSVGLSHYIKFLTDLRNTLPQRIGADFGAV
jgi:hypothetical protein